jgi:hypothetical protein
VETFIVRVWTPADGHPAADPGLHGEVKHISSGAASGFNGGEELLAFLATPIDDRTPAGSSRSAGDR